MRCPLHLVLLLLLTAGTAACSRDWDGLVDDARRNQEDADSDAGEADGGPDAGPAPDAGMGDGAASDADTDGGADAGPVPDAGPCADEGGDLDEDGICDDVELCRGDDASGDDDGDDICNDSECVRYVRTDGRDSNTGESWDDAVFSVQAAIGLAQGGQCDVWVAEGTYLPTLDLDGDPGPPDLRELSFVMTPGVSLYGGFVGNEEERTDRAWPPAPTVLSGDLGMPGDESDNAYHVVTAAADTVIDGFTVSGGRVSVSRAGGRDRGAGIRAESADRLLLRELRVTDNAAVSGGGIFISNSSGVKLEGVVVEGNSANLLGGGLLVQGSDVLLDSTEVRRNVAVTGGGVRVENGTLEMWSASVSDNTGQGISIDNGGDSTRAVRLYESIVFANSRGGFFATGADVYIEGSFVVANSGAVEGAGLYLDSGALELSTSVVSHNDASSSTGNGAGVWVSHSDFTVTDSSFVRNAAGNVGGAIYAQSEASSSTSTYVKGSTFVGNVSADDGGAIYSTGPTMDVVDCAFVANASANARGGAIAVRPPDGDVRVSGSTFYANSAESAGGAIFFEGTDLAWVNGVAYGNTPEALSHITGEVNVAYLCSDYPPPGNAIIDLDGSTPAHTMPFDAMPGSGELYLYQPDTGVGSACVDAGTDAVADEDLPEWPTLSTALDGTLDTGAVDLGRHYPADKAVIDFLDTTSTTGMVAWSTARARRCWLFTYGQDADGTNHASAVELSAGLVQGGAEMLPAGLSGGVTLACFGDSGEPAVIAEAL